MLMFDTKIKEGFIVVKDLMASDDSNEINPAVKVLEEIPVTEDVLKILELFQKRDIVSIDGTVYEDINPFRKKWGE